MKVIKFGGSSLATAERILIARNIVLSDTARRFVVVSAPGKFGETSKVTDLLIQAHTQLCISGQSDSLNQVIKRFENLGAELDVDISHELDRCLDEAHINNCSRDFIISRGEYLMGILFAKLLGFRFVDATRLITIKANGKVDEAATRKKFGKFVSSGSDRGIVIGGFYGQLVGSNPTVKTFSRGGSDYSGAIAAVMLGARTYENFTDTYGVQTANPAIVGDTATIWRLDYGTLHRLADAGASVIYPECLPLLRRYSVPMVVDNTMDAGRRYTTVTQDKPAEPFFSITYQTQSNINKHTATVLVVYHQVPFDVRALFKILAGLDVYLTGFQGRGRTSGDIHLLSTTEHLDEVVKKLHNHFSM